MYIKICNIFNLILMCYVTRDEMNYNRVTKVDLSFYILIRILSGVVLVF